MGSFFGAIVQWLLSRLFHQSPPLSQEAQQAKQVGAVEVKLQTETQANVDIQVAIQAARAVDAAVAMRPDIVRDPDAFSRD